MKNAIISPLTNTSNVVEEGQIDAVSLIQKYKQKFQLDVNNLFQGVKSISIFKCVETGYRFYYPLFLSGDDDFYKHFGRYDWYYLPWKWEHEECLRYITESDNVLEVGAANGNFLEGLKRLKKIDGIGLELNSEAIKHAQRKGVNLINQSIQDHALEKVEAYDVVCSFQVLEHIANVRSVIESMITCLKPGGKLIISVPNNDSFIKDNSLTSAILNMPPHHMGLWNEEALKNLCHVFDLNYLETKIEPLQPIHSDTFQYMKVKNLLFNNDLLVRIYWKLKIHKLVRPILKIFGNYITGHSIMSVYIKPD